MLVTATMSLKPRVGIDFFPLLVDYEERMYAAGKIPGGWGRREGRPSEDAILSARMIDRPLRPLFPDGFRNDVQIVASVLCVDKSNSPTIAALIGASAALHISNILFPDLLQPLMLVSWAASSSLTPPWPSRPTLAWISQ